MSNKTSNQPTPDAQTPDQTQPTTEGTITPIPTPEEAPADSSAPQTVTMTLEQLDAFVSQRIAASQQTAPVAPAPVTTEPTTDQSTWPYGNQDKDQEFDLSEMTSLTELPADKVIVALPEYNTNSKGRRTSVDMENTRIQFLDPESYKAATKPDSETGTTTYQLLAIEPILLHQP